MWDDQSPPQKGEQRCFFILPTPLRKNKKFCSVYFIPRGEEPGRCSSWKCIIISADRSLSQICCSTFSSPLHPGSHLHIYQEYVLGGRGRRRWGENPTEQISTLEPDNPSIGVFELRKN